MVLIVIILKNIEGLFQNFVKHRGDILSFKMSKSLMCLFISLSLIKFSSSFDFKQFILDIVNHYSYTEIQIYELENVMDTNLISELWLKSVSVSNFHSNQSKILIPIFVLNKEDPSLRLVNYQSHQIWYLNEKNEKYLDQWKLRLDSLIYLWSKIDIDTIEIKVGFVTYSNKKF